MSHTGDEKEHANITDAALNAMKRHPDICPDGRAIVIYTAHGTSGVAAKGFPEENDDELVSLLAQALLFVASQGRSRVNVEVVTDLNSMIPRQAGFN